MFYSNSDGKIFRPVCVALMGIIILLTCSFSYFSSVSGASSGSAPSSAPSVNGTGSGIYMETGKGTVELERLEASEIEHFEAGGPDAPETISLEDSDPDLTEKLTEKSEKSDGTALSGESGKAGRPDEAENPEEAEESGKAGHSGESGQEKTEASGSARPLSRLPAETPVYVSGEDEDRSLSEPDFEDDWSLILINKEHLLPVDYEVELKTLKGGIQIDKRIASSLEEMIAAAKEDGVAIYVCSPYRTEEKQEALFSRKINFYKRQGYTQEEAYDLASRTVAIPGCSEHQAGLAVDFISDDYTLLDEGFEDTDAGKWLASNCADYGFILRYPKNKEDITEIIYEPWHFRYVGRKAAREMMENGMCLEEYVRYIGLIEDDKETRQ